MSRDRTFSPLFMLLAAIAAVAALYVAKPILLPIAFAVLLSFLLTPLANRIERWGIPRILSTIVVVAVAFSVLAILGWIVMAQLIELRYELPVHRDKILAKLSALKQLTKEVEDVGAALTKQDATAADSKTARQGNARPVEDGRADSPPDNNERRNPTPTEVPSASPTDQLVEEAATEAAETGVIPPTTTEGAVPVKVVAMPPTTLAQIQTWLGPLVAPLTTAGMIVVLLFFMLLDRENQRNRLIQLFGTANLHRTTEALTDATHRVGRYLRMQFLINAGYGICVALGLWFIGVPSAIMWGVLGFSLRFLPYLGPWLAAVMPILVSAAVSDGWTQPILVASMYVAYELVLNNVAEPMLYGSSIGVSTVGVIIAAIFWTWLWGPIGLVIAMPMTVCVVVLARYVPQLKFITVLLADQPPLTPAERVYQRLLSGDFNEPLKLARKHLKDSTLVKFYDEVLMPALILAEQDRHAGEMNDEQTALVKEAAEDLVAELRELADAEAKEKAIPAAERPAAQVLCIPLRDDADEITSKMLLQLLADEGFHVESGAAGALTGEVVDQVAASESDIVVISVLPPIRPRDSRLLWKRLRHRYPELPIVVGYWTGADANESLLPPAGDSSSKVATTLAEALAVIRAGAAQLSSKAETPKVDSEDAQYLPTAERVRTPLSHLHGRHREPT
jgi:predicted PurR-regulated permease PerM